MVLEPCVHGWSAACSRSPILRRKSVAPVFKFLNASPAEKVHGEEKAKSDAVRGPRQCRILRQLLSPAIPSPPLDGSSPAPASAMPAESTPSQNLRHLSFSDDEFAWLMEILDSFPPPSTLLSLELVDPFELLDDGLLLPTSPSEPDAEPPALSPPPSPSPRCSKRSRASAESSVALEVAAEFSPLSPLRPHELLHRTSWAPSTDFGVGRSPLLALLRPPVAPPTAATRRSSAGFSCCASSRRSSCLSVSASASASASTAASASIAATSASVGARLASLRPRARRRLF